MLNLNDYDYEIDEKKIALYPRKPRDCAKLLVIDQENNFIHSRFLRLKDFLKEGDIVVLNDTKTIKARLYGERENGGKCEILLLRKVSDEDIWEVMCKPAKRLKENTLIKIGQAKVLVIKRNEDGTRLVKFLDHSSNFVIKNYGHIPLPPYIKRGDEKKDKKYYQTVFAKEGLSIAAPTAGLHFTKRVLNSLEKCKIKIVYIRLDVGALTFKPLKEDNLDDFKMPYENYFISEEAEKELNNALRERKRVIAVGTTVVRALEDQMQKFNMIKAGAHSTNLFIKPPYDFKIVSGMITNFHLPKTTLLLLVCAFKGREIILNAYREAMNRDYLFYSYGDAMLMLK